MKKSNNNSSKVRAPLVTMPSSYGLLRHDSKPAGYPAIIGFIDMSNT